MWWWTPHGCGPYQGPAWQGSRSPRCTASATTSSSSTRAARPFAPAVAQVRALADRRTGVGCDQLIVIENPASGLADAFMRIRNADGGEVGGLRQRHALRRRAADAGEGRQARRHRDGGGAAGCGGRGRRRDQRRHGARSASTGGTFRWPKRRTRCTCGIEAGPLRDPVAVNVGNPHAVFFVEDAERAPIELFGPVVERHPLFPERTNVEAAQVLARDRIRLRVWERGVGLTRACGTGACAAAVAAGRRGLDRAARHRRARRRQPAHRLAARRSRADDRPGGDQLHRRARPLARRLKPRSWPTRSSSPSAAASTPSNPRSCARGGRRRVWTRSSSTPARSPARRCARRGRRSASCAASTRTGASSSPAAPRSWRHGRSPTCRRSTGCSATPRN